MKLCTTLAQGRFHYSCDGREMPVQDLWQLGDDADGRRILLSQRLVGADRFGLQVGAALSDGIVTECHVTWRDEVDEVSATYRLGGEHGETPVYGADIHADWCGPNGPQQSVLNGQARLLFPLMRIFMGPLLLKLADREEGMEVVSPDIVDPSQRGKLLAPRVSHRTARSMSGAAALKRAQELGEDVRGFYYQGDEAERDAHCYVDPRGLLVGYDWPSSTGRLWQVRLRDLEWGDQTANLLLT